MNYIAPLIGLGTMAIGIAAMIAPQFMSKRFGIETNGSGLPYVVATGVRDVFMGFAVLVQFYRQEMFSLALISIAIGFVALVDCVSVLKHGDKKTSIFHIGGGLVVLAYGVWLLLN